MKKVIQRFSITYENGTHALEMVSTTVIPELTSLAFLLTFIIATIALFIINRRKNLG